MKKISLLPMLALLIAIGASAFTMESSKKNQTSLYWFRYDDVQGQFVFDRHDVSPTIECDGLGSSCAQGFEQPNPNGQQVYPGINMLEELEKDE